MATKPVATLDTEVRELLEHLAEGLFPLAAWIADRDKRGGYRPPHAFLPWRQKDRALSPKDMGVVDYFEELLGTSTRDAVLGARWRALTNNPLRDSPLKNAAAWRARRKLDAAPRFGIAASDNAFVDAAGTPTSRPVFYDAYWPHLKAAVLSAAPKSPENWETLAKALFTDTSPHWPAQAPKSSVFVKQLARDFLHAMLGMRNPAPDPWRLALLIELGEHRRVGNSYTTDDARHFLEAFRRELAKHP